MNRKPFLKSLSEGRGNCPLPSRTHPQKQNLVVYTEELTHLSLLSIIPVPFKVASSASTTNTFICSPFLPHPQFGTCKKLGCTVLTLCA